MELKCDVLVVGAGPAGCSAAFHIIKQTDYEVIQCESNTISKYNRYHRMCGEVVSGRLFEETITKKKEFIIDKINTVQEYWPKDITFSAEMEGYIIDRPLFLKSINNDFEQFGGKTINNTVIDVSELQDEIKVKTISGDYICCKYLIAADGANSIIRKKIFPQEKVQKKLLLQCIVEKKPEPRTLKFYYDNCYEGDYKWIFPYGDYEKVGCPFACSYKFNVQERIIEKHARLVAYGGLKAYVKNNIMFVGDAAAQTNALSKGGIRPGIIAGKMAAEAIKLGNPVEYDSRWKKSLFASKIVNDAFHKRKEMDNDELANHLKPLIQKNRIISYVQMQVLYRKYLDLYRAYQISDETGW